MFNNEAEYDPDPFGGDYQTFRGDAPDIFDEEEEDDGNDAVDDYVEEPKEIKQNEPQKQEEQKDEKQEQIQTYISELAMEDDTGGGTYVVPTGPVTNIQNNKDIGYVGTDYKKENNGDRDLYHVDNQQESCICFISFVDKIRQKYEEKRAKKQPLSEQQQLSTHIAAHQELR